MNAIDALMVLDLGTEINQEQKTQLLTERKICVLKIKAIEDLHYVFGSSRRYWQIPWIGMDGFRDMPRTKLRCLL